MPSLAPHETGRPTEDAETLPDPASLTHCPACGGKWGNDSTCRCHAAEIRAGYLAAGYVLRGGRVAVPELRGEAS